MMVLETRFYDLLLVPVTATSDQIAKSFKKLALKYHPDKTNHNPECTEKFKDVSRAYEVLKDPHQRQIYDAYGVKGLDGTFEASSTCQQRRGGFNPSQQSRNPAFGFEQAVFSLLFADMSSAFGPGGHFALSFGQPPFGQASFSPRHFGHSFSCDMNFGNSGLNTSTAGSSRTVRPDHSSNRPRKTKKGSNIHHNFKVSLADLYYGKETKFLLPKMTKCSACNGHGCTNPKSCSKCEGSGRLIILVVSQFAQFEERRDCHACHGSGVYSRPEDICRQCDHGYRMESKIIEVSIPPGAKNGDKCILTGLADEGRDIVPGDVIIHLVEQPHCFLVRQGNDLFMEHDIDLKTALLGGRIVIQGFPRTGEDIIVYINVHGKKELNNSIHHLINAGEVVGPINSSVPKIVKGLGMPINDYVKDGNFVQSAHFRKSDDSAASKRGNLYIKFNVQLPNIAEFAGEDDLRMLTTILPDSNISESFGRVSCEHHLANVPGLESTPDTVDQKSTRMDDCASSDFDYEHIEIDSQDGSEEQEDTKFYAEEWLKEHEGKRRKVNS